MQHIVVPIETRAPRRIVALPTRVTASAVRNEVRNMIAEGGDDPADERNRYAIELLWTEALTRLGVPFAHSWCEVRREVNRVIVPFHRPRKKTHRTDEAVPYELRWQLWGQTLRSGLTAVYRGKRYLVVDTFDELGTLGETVAKVPRLNGLWLVDPHYIDLSA